VGRYDRDGCENRLRQIFYLHEIVGVSTVALLLFFLPYQLKILDVSSYCSARAWLHLESASSVLWGNCGIRPDMLHS